MRRVRTSPSAHHIKHRAFALKGLYSCTHLFIQVDAVKRPLEQSYEGPYKIIKRISDHVFKIIVKGEPTTTSTERLKSAYYEVCPTEPDVFQSQSPSTSNTKSTLKTYSGPKANKTVSFIT